MDSQLSYTVEKKPHQSFDYVFCYDRKCFRNLVMLAPHDKILKTILKDISRPNYFWVCQNSEKASEVVKSFPQALQQQSTIFTSVRKMQEFAEKDKNYQKIVVIVDTLIKQQFLNSKKNGQYLQLIEYFFGNEQQRCWSILQKDQKRTFDYQQSFDAMLKSRGELKNHLCCFQFSKNQEFSNFVLINKQIYKSKSLLHSFVALVTDLIDKETKNEILDQLDAVTLKMETYHKKIHHSYNHIHEILMQMKINQLSVKKAIQIYTSQDSKIYVLINTFLRAVDKSIELFYIQPLMKSLYDSINKLYQESPKKQFVCYRGGYANKEEVEKLHEGVGSVVQSLGFLSTSLSMQTIQLFKKNIVYEIRVPKRKGENCKNKGYADVSMFSSFCSEEEVIFNHLCFFKVLEIKRIDLGPQEQFYVILDYGEIDRLYQCPEAELKEQNKIIQNFVNQYDNLKLTEMTQGTSLLLGQTKQQLAQSLMYWHKSNSIQVGQNRCNLLELEKLALAYYNSNRFPQAICIFEACLQQNKFIFGSKSSYYLKLFNNLAHCYRRSGRLLQALKIYIQCQEMQRGLYGQKNCSYLCTLANIAGILFQLENYQQSLFLNQKCLKLEIDVLGENHPLSIKTLNNLANIYFKLGNYQKSLSLHNNCLFMEKAVLGQKSKSYIGRLTNKALILYRLGQPQESLKLFSYCGAILKEILGEDHPQYIQTSTNLAAIFYVLGQHQEALKIYKKYQEKRLEIFGQYHLDNMLALYNTALILKSVGKFEQSMSLFSKCSTIVKKIPYLEPTIYSNMIKTIFDALSSVGLHKKALEIVKVNPFQKQKIIQVERGKRLAKTKKKSTKNFRDFVL